MATADITKKSDLGLSSAAVEDAVELLQTLLADEYVLYTKLRNYHWNVTGSQFKALHEIFEEQYIAIEQKIDVTAERARSYGVPVIGTLAEFKETARLSESPGERPSSDAMIANLAADHEAIIRALREDIKTAGEQIQDVGLEDFLTGTLQEHQEMAWMLRSFLGQ